MKQSLLPALAIVSLLSACHQGEDATSYQQRSQGRYAGVGIYDAGALWGKMLGVPKAGDLQAAGIGDDEHIIVVVDTRTGEIRQCGDHSGYCVATSPWASARPVPALPAKLSAHSEDKSVAKGAIDEASSAK